MILDISLDELQAACRTIYEPGGYAHAPEQLFIDHYAGDPETTFLRVSFPQKFTNASACKLEALRGLLRDTYGKPADIVFVIYFDVMDADTMARHAVAIADR